MKIGVFFIKHGRVPNDKEFRLHATKLDIPSKLTLKKYCPEPLDIVFSQACGLDTCETILQKYIENSESKRVLFVRAKNLSSCSWAPSSLIAQWLCRNENKIIAGYRLTRFSTSAGGDVLFKLTAVRPWGAGNE